MTDAEVRQKMHEMRYRDWLLLRHLARECRKDVSQGVFAEWFLKEFERLDAAQMRELMTLEGE